MDNRDLYSKRHKKHFSFALRESPCKLLGPDPDRGVEKIGKGTRCGVTRRSTKPLLHPAVKLPCSMASYSESNSCINRFSHSRNSPSKGKKRNSNGQRNNESRHLQGAPRRSHRRPATPQDQRADRHHSQSDIHCFVRQVSCNGC